MSLRKGHFKKNMFTEEQLALEAVTLHPKIEKIRTQWKNNELTDAQMAAHYILTIVHHRYPFHTMLGPVREIFSERSLRGVPQAVNKMILNWIDGNANLILLEHVPTPKEVLAQQKQGKRCVTMMTALSGLSKNVLGERDALGFLIHDLQHAERFFAHHDTQKGQIGFYHFIGELFELDEVRKMMKQDTQFCEEFEYAMSDMNAYCVHLLKYLTSAFREASKRLNCTCPFLEAITTYQANIQKIVEKVYFLNEITQTETLLLQYFFEGFNEHARDRDRDHAFQKSICETIP